MRGASWLFSSLSVKKQVGFNLSLSPIIHCLFFPLVSVSLAFTVTIRPYQKDRVVLSVDGPEYFP